MSKTLEGRVVIVTGGGSGIGEAASLIMAREGARVLVADINDEGGHRTVAQITQASGEALFVHTDVTQENQVAAMVDAALQRWGRLDCAFNNAGMGNKPALVADLATPDWQWTLDLVLNGVYFCMKYEIAAMLKTGGGSIVNTSSNAGVRAVPTQSAYSAAKAGVIGMTRTVAIEYAKQGLRVNAICPGLIMTPVIQRLKEEGQDWEAAANIPMGRGGKPSEIGEVAAWLCSDRSSYLTGQAISVDGGSTCL